MSESSSSKKPRASKPKVKTGCMTCKSRRVKCDETKPECLRCSNFGRKCGGYPSLEESPPPPKGPTLPVPRRLLSKAMAPSPTPSPCPSPIPFVTTPTPTHQPPLPQTLSFQTEKEYRYFCHFREETAIRLSTGFPPSLWNTLIVTACTNPPIRQLSIAVAALDLAMTVSPSVPGDVDKSAHHQYGLQQYGEALTGIRGLVNMEEDSMRPALISALLIFCLESLQGNTQAITHVQSAIEMIVRRISHEPRLFYFGRVSAMGVVAESRIDQELLTAFMRLDQPFLSLLTRKRGVQVTSERIFNILFGTEHLEIPRGFATIAEARVYFEDIKWRILTDAQPPEELSRAWDARSEGIDQLSLPLQLKQWYEVSGVLKTSSLSLELAHWHDAFSPILNYAMSPNGGSLYSAAVILHIQGLAADLLTSGIFARNEGPSRSSSSDEQTSDFPTVNAIIAMSRRLITHPQFSRDFVFDAGIIPALVDVWLLCPAMGLRMEAIEVLESMVPRREGYWDSRIAAEAGRRYLEQERN